MILRLSPVCVLRGLVVGLVFVRRPHPSKFQSRIAIIYSIRWLKSDIFRCSKFECIRSAWTNGRQGFFFQFSFSQNGKKTETNHKVPYFVCFHLPVFCSFNFVDWLNWRPALKPNLLPALMRLHSSVIKFCGFCVMFAIAASAAVNSRTARRPAASSQHIAICEEQVFCSKLKR